MRAKVIEILQRYSGKKYIYLTQRGNISILLALKAAKAKGKKKVLVQDQGGWLTYLQYPERLKMELIKMPTDYGIVKPNELSRYANEECVALINSLSGYYAEQPIGLIYAICKQKNCLLINDASGSIGTETAKIGELIIGSFGESKPVNLHYGGFLACDEAFNIFDDAIFDPQKLPHLYRELEKLPSRLEIFEKHNKKIKKDLASLHILHPDKHGINVVIAFRDEFEKERVINYCNEHDYEYTECPRYIRVNVPAICIEVKRLKG